MQLSIPVTMPATVDDRNKKSLNAAPIANNKLHQDLVEQITKRCIAIQSITAKILVDKSSLVFSGFTLITDRFRSPTFFVRAMIVCAFTEKVEDLGYLLIALVYSPTYLINFASRGGRSRLAWREFVDFIFGRSP
jgi:hypothetical protein